MSDEYEKVTSRFTPALTLEQFCKLLYKSSTVLKEETLEEQLGCRHQAGSECKCKHPCGGCRVGRAVATNFHLLATCPSRSSRT